MSAEEIIAEDIIFTDEFLEISPKARVNSSITINMVGMSTYLDFSSMGSDFDKSMVEYSSEDADVAIAWDGL